MGRPQSQITRERIRLALLGRAVKTVPDTTPESGLLFEPEELPVTGPKHTRGAVRGRKLTDEHRRKIGEASRGRRPTPETRRRMSEAAARRDSPAPRSHIRYSLDYEGNIVTHQSEREMLYFRQRCCQPGVWIRAYDAKRDGVLPYEFEGQVLHFRPDFVEFREGHTDKVLVECKPTTDLATLVPMENAYYKVARIGDKTAAKLAAYPEVELVSPK